MTPDSMPKEPIYRLKHVYTGQVSDYVVWDGVMSWEGRAFMACPVCGIGLCAPLGRAMVHGECAEFARRKSGGAA